MKSCQLFPVCHNSHLEIVLCHGGIGNRDDYLRKVIESSDLLELTSPETATTSLVGFQPAIWPFPAKRPEKRENKMILEDYYHLTSPLVHTGLHHNDEVTMPMSLCLCAALPSGDVGAGHGLLDYSFIAPFKEQVPAFPFSPLHCSSMLASTPPPTLPPFSVNFAETWCGHIFPSSCGPSQPLSSPFSFLCVNRGY